MGKASAQLLFEIFIAKVLYHCEIIKANDNVLFGYSFPTEARFDSGNLRRTPEFSRKGIRVQLDFWLGKRNNTSGYRAEISDLSRFSEALA